MYKLPSLLFGSTLVFCLLCFSCKNDSGAPVQAPQPPADVSKEKPFLLYVAKVDKLNLRDASNKNGKVLAQLALGELVEGTGEVSANKEEVTLRNIPYNEPYFKVINTAKQSGWAYSAALEPVYAGPAHTAPDRARVAQLSTFLATLPATDLDSGKKAWDFVRQQYGNAQGTLADAAFMLLESFLFRMEIEGSFYMEAEKINWSEAEYTAIDEEKFDMNKYPFSKKCAASGFRLDVGEGMVFPVRDMAPLVDFFATRATPPMKRYMEQLLLEQKNRMWSDGGIIIPLEQVADRAAWWGKFNTDNPVFTRSEETANFEKGLIFMLICGADNTPVFDYESGALQPECKKAWQYTIDTYPGTEIARAVKEMSDLVTAEGGKRSKKVEQLMEKYMTE